MPLISLQQVLINMHLVIGADCLSKITDYTDRNTCILFGDGAGAVVIGEVPEERGFKSFELVLTVQEVHLLKIEGGGSRILLHRTRIDQRLHYIYMAGAEVFKFAVRIMGNAADEACVKQAGRKQISIC